MTVTAVGGDSDGGWAMTGPGNRPHARRSWSMPALVIAFGVGSLVSVGLGVYGSLHEPTFFALQRRRLLQRPRGQGVARDRRVRARRRAAGARP
jgi:hypothetical protein